jgi:hypothetical protein
LKGQGLKVQGLVVKWFLLERGLVSVMNTPRAEGLIRRAGLPDSIFFYGFVQALHPPKVDISDGLI